MGDVINLFSKENAEVEERVEERVDPEEALTLVMEALENDGAFIVVTTKGAIVALNQAEDILNITESTQSALDVLEELFNDLITEEGEGGEET